MPRLAETVRLNVPPKTEKTSVVAPPMSTPMTDRPRSRAIVSMIRPTAPGVGMTGRGGPAPQHVVARRLLHDVLHEQVVDLVACRAQVLLVERGAQVVHDRELGLGGERVAHRLRGVLVAGVDHRAAGSPRPGAAAGRRRR
jgi:hypothetical protein